MPFVCAQCRYRVLSGLLAWEDCVTCRGVGAAVKALPPYEPPERPPFITYVAPSTAPPKRFKPPWRKPYVRQREAWYYRQVLSPEAITEGRGDPQLPYECFTDFTLPYELRAKMRNQLELEFYLAPEIDWLSDWWPKKRGRKRSNLVYSRVQV